MKRRKYSSQFKATVALEAVRNQRTVAQIASEYGVHPNQVGQWKKQILEQLPQIFDNKGKPTDADNERLVAELYRQIGQLKVELDWLQKKTERFR